ncbi:N-formylglutamate amidohydrolase [Catalinimonas niigatensis]|uniref:N-formylglutamate amidohydrolase n=1 Tax=Catalinimonas niigatensis TaxID=1397264 RepID=UPI00266667A1|nr:N-formylglutamate amidohydrolase [Catalinimonas niigatensis]WPP50911.1 N-formylglutamate amidohydrolase [Catalinimonas niigatensis]
MASYALILSCEHGGNHIPPAYIHLFEAQEKVLQSHQGWDPGTLNLAQALSDHLGIPLVACTISRLLIEMNRSLDNPELFSRFTSSLSVYEKSKLIQSVYLPYRRRVEKQLDIYQKNGKISLHFSIHSFTPIFNGSIRDTDIGILFDPARPLEVDICAQIKAFLQNALPDMQVIYNSPYKGTDDGLTTYLRTKYAANTYAGVEIEINQKWVNTEKFDLIQTSLQTILYSFIKRKPGIE